MKERGILFSGPMVRAILDGRKTQTRRIVKPMRGWEKKYPICRPDMMREDWQIWWHGDETDRVGVAQYCPHGVPGDRLWVRETHWRYGKWRKDGQTKTGRQRWRFVATRGHNETTYPDQYVRFDAPEQKPDREDLGWHKRSPLFLNRQFSRITIEVTGVRVERVRDIHRADAIAEGIQVLPLQSADDPSAWWQSATGLHQERTPQASYAGLWESIHGLGSWNINPFVWVVSFKGVSI